MKVALVHDWLTGMRGGENVLEVFCSMFPDADLYTLVHIPHSVSPVIEKRKIYTSFLQKYPNAAKRYRWYLPLMPRAIESFELEDYDLVISSSHCVAKGIRPGGAPHFCYCHTPMRYAWDMYDQYFNHRRFSWPTLFLIGRIMPYLRRWDQRTAPRVDRFIANSHNVRERIYRLYERESDVIYPPVDVEYYTPAEGYARDAYLIVSAFAPYKRVDLAISLFNKTGRELVIAGGGEDEKRLRGMAKKNIKFVGSVSKEELRELYRSARALIYPGEEDFGIIPVEAMACGTPVIAYGKGGALETVIPLRDIQVDTPTGVYFDRQTVGDLDNAITRFEANEHKFRPEFLAAHAKIFAAGEFKKKIYAFLKRYNPKFVSGR